MLIKIRPVKTKVNIKSLNLIGDLLGEVLNEDQENVTKFIASLKLCKQLEIYFGNNRRTLITDAAQKAVSSLNDMKQHCHQTWSESPEFRHEILVQISNCKAKMENDKDSIYEEILELLEELYKFLYSHLKISESDLKYNDEL